jgi:hypothetical protein
MQYKRIPFNLSVDSPSLLAGEACPGLDPGVGMRGNRFVGWVEERNPTNLS